MWDGNAVIVKVGGDWFVIGMLGSDWLRVNNVKRQSIKDDEMHRDKEKELFSLIIPSGKSVRKFRPKLMLLFSKYCKS